jgi:glycerol-3-phosphate dehydrogenase
MQRDLPRLADEHFDVVVVGGGIHGAWIALRATAQGFRTALLERDDFGGATSANSLKILHGGLRYLQSLDIPRMRKSVAARREFALLAPQLIRPIGCLLPLSALGIRSPWAFGPALLLNEAISFGQRSGVSPAVRLPRGHLVPAERSNEQLRLLAGRNAFSGGVWWDLLMDESDRMTLQVVLEASRLGAVVANHLEALELRSEGGVARGVAVRDGLTDRTFEIRGRMIVDATGPWAGQLSARADLPTDFLPRNWVGGLNLVLRRDLGNDLAVALTARVDGRKRELFIVPWRGTSMVGTHYVAVAGPTPLPPAGAVTEFIELIATVAPAARVTAADVALVHWGTLPCAVGSTLDPMGNPIACDGVASTGLSGLMVVVGEKYTSAPVVSSDVVGRIAAGMRPSGSSAPAPARESVAADTAAESWPAQALQRLRTRNADASTAILELCRAQPEFAEPVAPGSPVVRAEVVHAIRHEMAQDLGDIVQRRLGIGEGGSPGIEVLQACARVAAPEFGWDAERADQAATELQQWFDRRSGGGQNGWR